MPLIFTTRHGRPELIGSLQLFSAREVIWRRIKFQLADGAAELGDHLTTALWLIFSWTMRFHLSARWRGLPQSLTAGASGPAMRRPNRSHTRSTTSSAR